MSLWGTIEVSLSETSIGLLSVLVHLITSCNLQRFLKTNTRSLCCFSIFELLPSQKSWATNMSQRWIRSQRVSYDCSIKQHHKCWCNFLCSCCLHQGFKEFGFYLKILMFSLFIHFYTFWENVKVCSLALIETFKRVQPTANMYRMDLDVHTTVHFCFLLMIGDTTYCM